MMRHMKQRHPPTSKCYHVWGENAYMPIKKKRPAQWFRSQAGRAEEVGPVALAGPSVNHADSVEKPCGNAFAGLALRQPGARPPSLEDVAAYMSLFQGLLRFVLLEECIPGAMLSKAEWCRFVSMSVPAPLRHFCPNWWRTYPKVVLTQKFKDRELAPMRANGQAPLQAVFQNEQVFVAAPVADRLASDLRYCMQGAQAFFLDLTGQHDEKVWHSHGDHVPLTVRDGATYLWWLPELLRIDYSQFDREAGATFWTPRLEALIDVSEYVSKRMPAFKWPPVSGMATQYKGLVSHWANLHKNKAVREKAWDRDGTTFQWEAWWMMCHTNEVSDNMKLDFVPAGLEAAWALFHYTGMLGTSEAAAESVGSILKRYSNAGLTTSRVVESTVLRWSDVRGEGGDDAFLQLCWTKFFGSASVDRYQFEYKGRPCRKRAKLWGGSTTLQRRLRDAATNRWATRDLRLAEHAATANGSPWQGNKAWMARKRKMACKRKLTS